MTGLDLLGFALGSAFASGLNVYATVAALGLLHRYEFFTLPQNLEVLANPWVLGTAMGLYLVEFLADKVPYLDTAWDAVHTFIRPPAAVVLAYAALGDVGEPMRVVAGLVAGTFALTAHGTKASARLAANASPEPVTNWALSLGEDVLAFALVGLVTQYPLLALAAVIVLLVLSIWVLLTLRNLGRRLFGRRQDAMSSA